MTNSKAMLALVALLCLSGCASPGPVSSIVCPSVVRYTPQEEAEIADELAALSDHSVLRKVADEDYHLRTALRACRR